MNKRVLLIGCGNPLRSDDGVAHEIVRRLEVLSDPLLAHVEIELSHQLTPEMAESSSSVSRVIVIDAEIAAEAGKVLVHKVEPTIAEQAPAGLSHDFDPETLLNTTRELYGVSPELYVVSIGAQHFEHGESLSPAVIAAIPHAIDEIRKLISSAIIQGSKQHA